MSLEIRAVASKKDRKTFIALPAKLQAGRPFWVPPLYADERKYFDPAKNKAFGYCDVVLWLAFREGEPVGRVMGSSTAASTNTGANRSPGSATSRRSTIPRSSTPSSPGSSRGPGRKGWPGSSDPTVSPTRTRRAS